MNFINLSAFLLISLIELSLINTCKIKDFFPHIECAAPANYRSLKEFTTKECNSMIIKNYFTNFDDKKLKKCLDLYMYMDLKGEQTENMSFNCNKKNRFNDIYNYKGMALSNKLDSLYLNSAKYDGELILENDVYKYIRGINSTGFMVATTSPIGNVEDITHDKTFNEKCGGPNGFNGIHKIPGKDCYSRNVKLPDGSFNKENTILSFYNNLKIHEITYVIMLSNFIMITNPNCICKLRSDKYFPFTNETFRIKKPDHLEDSNFSVDGVENNKLRNEVIGTDEDVKDYIEFRELSLKNNNITDHKFNHIFYKSWPDHSIPSGKGKEILFKLIKFVRAKLDNKENVIIHCTGGIGRTGSFVTAVLTSNLDSSKSLNLFEFITELRKQRSQFINPTHQIRIVKENMELTKKEDDFIYLNN